MGGLPFNQLRQIYDEKKSKPPSNHEISANAWLQPGRGYLKSLILPGHKKMPHPLQEGCGKGRLKGAASLVRPLKHQPRCQWRQNGSCVRRCNCSDQEKAPANWAGAFCREGGDGITSRLGCGFDEKQAMRGRPIQSPTGTRSSRHQELPLCRQ